MPISVAQMWIEMLDNYGPEQRRAFDFAVDRPGTLLLGDTGVGKTIISLAVLEKTVPHLTLVVAPLTSLDITWMPKLTQSWVTLRTWNDFKMHRKLSGGPAVLLIHFQLMVKLITKLEKVDWDLVIIDESQALKDRASAMSRAARRLRHAERRLALSATPIDKSPIELFGQMRFVDVDVLGDSFPAYAADWCMQGGYKGKKWIFREQLMEEYLSMLREHIYRLHKEFMQLPPLTVQLCPVMMLGEQQRVYDRMAKHGIVDFDDGTVIPAPFPVTRQGKLEQITGGTILNEEGGMRIVGRAKVRKLQALCWKLTPPVVVFCKFLGEIPIIREALPWEDVGELHGGIMDKPRSRERTDLINAFQNGELKALICQVRTGGTSISLTAASNVIFYSQNFSLIDFEQIIGRFHRPGQTRPVNVYVLYAINSRDEEITAEIEAKHDRFYKVVNFFK